MFTFTAEARPNCLAMGPTLMDALPIPLAVAKRAPEDLPPFPVVLRGRGRTSIRAAFVA